MVYIYDTHIISLCYSQIHRLWNLGLPIYTVLCKSNANEFRQISSLFVAFRGNFTLKEISANFPRTFESPIVSVHQNFERYFTADTKELWTFEGKFALLESSVRNFQRKFALVNWAKCCSRFVVKRRRNIRNQFHPLNSIFYCSFLLKPQ